MMSLTFGLFTQVSGSGPLGPLVHNYNSRVANQQMLNKDYYRKLAVF